MEKEKSEFEKGRAGAMTFGGLVYAGVVVAATTLFVSFVLTAFPSNAYFSRLVMIVAGLLIGASMVAFPYALHTWAISGKHRQVTIALYYGEMAIIALNTVVSFAALLFEYAQIVLPDWILWYEPFSIISIVYTLFAWGTIFLTDPAAKAKAKELEADQEFARLVAEKKMEFLNSLEGEDAIMAAASAEIEKSFGTANFENGKRHFGSGKTTTSQVVRQVETPEPVHASNNGKGPLHP